MTDAGADEFDLVVIGAGPAGEKGGAQAAFHGKRVALIDAGPRPGGVAVSTGGIPTKTLRESAIHLSGLGHRAQDLAQTEGSRLTVMQRLMRRKDGVSKLMTMAVERNIKRHGMELIHGRARLLPGHVVHVDLAAGGVRTLRAGAVLVATGSKPAVPTGIPVGDPGVIDSESVFGLSELPVSLIVLGAGAVGCEYASIFAALGVRVTLVDSKNLLLPLMDAEISHALAESFNEMGIRILAGARVSSVERADAHMQVRLEGGLTLEGERVLVATGRRPNTAGLDLEEVGVELSASGHIQVDQGFETAAKGVFAAGDVLGPPGLASIAMEQARVAVCHAFGLPFKTRVDPLCPLYVYSIPEVAAVGMTEAQARAAEIDYEVGRASFMGNAKARISGFPDGLVKLVFRASDKSLIGVHIAGELASELIHIGQFVMHDGGSIERFIHATFSVPSRSEAYKYAAYDGLTRLEQRAAAPDGSALR